MKNKLLLLLLMLFTSNFLFAAAPTTRATNILFTNVTSTQADISWTDGDGANRVVFVLAGNSGLAVPVDLTTYTANTAFGLGTQIGVTGWYNVYNGAGSTVTVTGLTAGTTYRVMVLEYNGSGGSEEYLQGAGTNNPLNVLTTFTAPGTQASLITFANDLTTQVDLGWTNGNGTARAVFMFLGNSGTAAPVDRTTYTANTTFGSGTQIGVSGWYCVYNGTGTSVTVTGLAASTYRVMVIEFNGTAGAEGYNTSTATGNPLNRILPISLSNPSQYALGVSVLPTLDWTTPGASTTYELEISLSSSFGSIITLSPAYASPALLHTFTYSSTASTVLANGTTYYWRVRRTTAEGTSAWAKREFTTVNVSKPTINPILPGVASAFIGWYPIPYSSGLRYDLTYSLNLDMSSPIGTISNLTNTYYTLTGLTNGTPYYVQVRSKNVAGTIIISYSTVSTFTTTGPPIPTRSYPIDGTTVYASKPTFFWYIEGNEPGVDYQIRYRLSSGSYSGVQVSSTSNKLYKTLTTNLTAGETYVWQVRSFVGSSYSNWSTAGDSTFVMFSSVATTPPVPIPSWPDGSPTPTIYSNPPVLYYYIDVYATGLEFRVQYSTSPTFVSGNVDLPWTTDLFSAVAVSLIPGQQYYWHVKSKLLNAPFTESLYSATATFIVATTASGAATTPIPSYPVGGAILDSPLSGITLSWTAPATQSLDYQVRISQSSSVNGSGMLNHPAALSTVGYPVTDPTNSILVSSIPYTLTAGATYYWQVRSRLNANNLIFSPWSMVASFATAAGSSSVVPLVISPNYLQPINNSSAVLTWKIPVPTDSHLKYDLQYSKSVDFSNAVSKTNLNEPVTQVTGLAPGSTYYWRVLSKNDKGSISDYSTMGTFKTSGTTAVEENASIPTQFELSQNYPNPFNPTTKISYALPQNAFVNIKVYDMLGREVKSLVNNEMLAGNYSVEWSGVDNSGNKVASGAYIYRVTAGNFISTKKMVLLK